MDAMIKQTIDGYRMGMQNFRSTLGEDHPLIKKADALLAKLDTLGEKSNDVGAFMGSAAAEMGEMGNLMAELASAQPEPAADRGAEAASPAGGEPTVAQAAAGFHMAFNALNRNDPANKNTVAVYEEIFEYEAQATNPAQFNRMLAEHNIYTRLASEPQLSIARQGRETVAALDQPCLAYHYAELEKAMGNASSPTTVEYAANLLAEYNSVENEWDATFAHYATKAIGEVVGFLMDKSETQQETVVNAYRFVCHMFGRDWEGMWQCPRVWERWLLIYRESGDAFLKLFQAETPEQARDGLTKVFQGILEARGVGQVELGPPENQHAFSLWGQNLHMDELLQAYQHPQRPEPAQG